MPARSVLLADVVALPVQRGRIVNLEEHFEQIFEGDFGGVEGDAHHFDVSRIAVADLPVCRIVDLPAGVSRVHRLHSPQAVKYRFEAPETSTTQKRNLLICHGHWMRDTR